MFRTTLNPHRPLGSMLSEAHYDAARRIAEEGIVLLQNKGGLLPIDLSRAKKIAVIGENAIKMMTVGGGSSSLKVQHECTPLDGIRRRVADSVEVVFARGYVGDVSGEYNGVTTGQDLRDDRTPDVLRDEAVRTAAQADYVIFFGGLNKSAGQDCEDADRTGLSLPYGQDSLIAALAKANKNLIVVNVSGNAVAMPWADDVPAIMQAWFLGSEAGNAIAAVLTGDVSPSGKLPFTFPAKLEDVAAHSLNAYTGERKRGIVDIEYKESIFVGYRWADKHTDKEPLFPFGHGLSYTTFDYGKPRVDAKSRRMHPQFPPESDDFINVVTFLKSPAEIIVNGEKIGAAKGEGKIEVFKTPLKKGKVRLEISRGGKNAIELEGTEWITDKPYRTDRITYCICSLDDSYYGEIFGKDAPRYFIQQYAGRRGR